jgi:hypothetical protein
MPVYKFREPAVERFLALSARYLFHAQTCIDPRGRVLIEWPQHAPQLPQTRHAAGAPRRETRAASA